MKVWMITGDKGDTAQQIGYSCGLFPQVDFTIYRIEEGDKTIDQQLEKISSIKTSDYGFMVAGNQL